MELAMTEEGELLLFGYGSLVWRPGDLAASVEKTTWGSISGWKRRFWQGSPDHRGTHENPGRVVTLLRDADVSDSVWGKVYWIRSECVATVMPYLTHREKAGYEEAIVQVSVVDESTGEKRIVHAMVFTANSSNDWFLGEAPLSEMAHHIAHAHGPSGPNTEYLLQLATSLRDRGIHDEHVHSLEAALLEMVQAGGSPAE